MKIEINIEKKCLYILTILLFFVGAAFVIAYKTDNPGVFGHSLGEIAGLDSNNNGVVDEAEHALIADSLTTPVEAPSGMFCGLCGDCGYTCAGNGINVKPCKGHNVCIDCPAGYTRYAWTHYFYGSTVQGSGLDWICVKD